MSTIDHAASPDVALSATEQEPGDILVEVEQLIAALTTHPDPAVGETAKALLDRIDIVHRAALTHLMGAIQSMAGEAFVNRLTADPAIRLLMMSYDLLAVDRRTLAEEALDAVRGHLHAHGVDVELVDVLGGVVTVQLHGAPMPGGPAYADIRRDVEDALRAGLLGFQAIEVRNDGSPGPTPKDSVFIPVESLQRARKPVYREVCRADDLPDGSMRSAVLDGVSILVARVGAEFLAVLNACGESPLPLDYSTLTGTELRCSWHGCRYDMRTGHRLDRPDAARAELLRILPVRVNDGVVEVAVGTTGAR